ncbi:MAG: hypothetical protein AAF667_01215 [Pseudomonadota bacterium]
MLNTVAAVTAFLSYDFGISVGTAWRRAVAQVLGHVCARADHCETIAMEPIGSD